MNTSDSVIVEHCAQVAELAADELAGLAKRPAARKYDQQTRAQYKVAGRWVLIVRDRIRMLATPTTSPVPTPLADTATLDEALDLIRQLRPVVKAARSSAWKIRTLHRMDMLLR